MSRGSPLLCFILATLIILAKSVMLKGPLALVNMEKLRTVRS